MSEPSEDSTQCTRNSPFFLELNCCGTQQLMWLERQYLTSPSNDMNVSQSFSLSVRLLRYLDSSQANYLKQQNKHMEIAYHLVCWERHTA